MNAYIDISDTVIKTERLTLRPWKNSDLDDFFEYASVPKVGEAAGWPHHKGLSELNCMMRISCPSSPIKPEGRSVLFCQRIIGERDLCPKQLAE